jgi:hypothetical protein
MFILFGIPTFHHIGRLISSHRCRTLHVLLLISVFVTTPICDGRAGSSRRIIGKRGGPGKEPSTARIHARSVFACFVVVELNVRAGIDVGNSDVWGVVSRTKDQLECIDSVRLLSY